MTNLVSRRGLLTSLGTSIAVGMAGCSGSLSGLSRNSGGSRTIGERDTSLPDEWPTLGQNPHNTKFNPGGEGPKDEPSIEWTYSSGHIRAPPAISRSTVALSGVETFTILATDGTERLAINYSGILDELRSYSFPVTITDDIVCSAIRDRPGSPFRVVGYTHTGELDWEFELGNPSSGATPFVTHHNGSIFVSLGTAYDEITSPSIMAINPDDGEILWSKQHDISFTYPLVTDERVLFHANERLQAYEIETGDTLWEFDTLNNRIARPVVADDTVYVEYGDETVGLKLNDGSKGPEITKSFEGEFAFVDDAVIESVGDKLRAYDLQRDELLWEKDYPARLNPPAVADGIAYVGGEDKRIRGVEISTGQELWSRQLKDDVMRPVVAQGSVLVVSGETLYSLA